jgi:hypothetical protein
MYEVLNRVEQLTDETSKVALKSKSTRRGPNRHPCEAPRGPLWPTNDQQSTPSVAAGLKVGVEVAVPQLR